MDEFPRYGQELADAQAQLDQVLARCAIRLKAFDGIAAANDNRLFSGIRAPVDDSLSGSLSTASHDIGGQ